MNNKRIFKRICLVFVAPVFFLSSFSLSAQDNGMQELTPQQKKGMDLFQGNESFVMGGPSCVTCHNVTNDKMIPGGLFAKDLTDVYDRLGEGLTGWLGAPPFPAMAASYNNNPLTEEERTNLTAFFKYSNEVKETQATNTGYSYFMMGSGIGLVVILLLIQILWSTRKRKMVKEDIFKRQNKAWDAKF